MRTQNVSMDSSCFPPGELNPYQQQKQQQFQQEEHQYPSGISYQSGYISSSQQFNEQQMHHQPQNHAFEHPSQTVNDNNSTVNQSYGYDYGNQQIGGGDAVAPSAVHQSYGYEYGNIQNNDVGGGSRYVYEPSGYGYEQTPNSDPLTYKKESIDYYQQQKADSGYQGSKTESLYGYRPETQGESLEVPIKDIKHGVNSVGSVDAWGSEASVEREGFGGWISEGGVQDQDHITKPKDRDEVQEAPSGVGGWISEVQEHGLQGVNGSGVGDTTY